MKILTDRTAYLERALREIASLSPPECHSSEMREIAVDALAGDWTPKVHPESTYFVSALEPGHPALGIGETPDEAMVEAIDSGFPEAKTWPVSNDLARDLLDTMGCASWTLDENGIAVAS